MTIHDECEAMQKEILRLEKKKERLTDWKNQIERILFETDQSKMHTESKLNLLMNKIKLGV